MAAYPQMVGNAAFASWLLQGDSASLSPVIDLTGSGKRVNLDSMETPTRPMHSGDDQQPPTKRARTAARITKSWAKKDYVLTDTDLKKLLSEKEGKNVTFTVEDVIACAHRKHGGAR